MKVQILVTLRIIVCTFLIVPIARPIPTLRTDVTGQEQQISLSGWFHVIEGDVIEGSTLMAISPVSGLVDDKGYWTPLDIDEKLTQPFGGLSALNGKRVNIVGVLSSLSNTDAPEVQPLQKALIRVVSIELMQSTISAGSTNMAGVTGSKPWLMLLCRAPDSYVLSSDALSFYGKVIGSEYPGLDHYWREVSYNNINLTGSQVAGWYMLPNPSSYYWTFDGASYYFDLERVTNDCTAAADADVYFPGFSGISIILPAPQSYEWRPCSQGGSWTLNIDGQTRNYGFIWIPHEIGWTPDGSGQGVSILGHEMAHAFGLPHSSGPYSNTYDSSWDVVSGTLWGYPCNPTDPIYVCIYQHTISYHKDRLGWIPASRKYVASQNSQATITLERLALPPTGNYLMAQIPIAGSSSHFYTVEARRFAGYDSQLPGEAVIIHDVDTTRSDRLAQVVDIDGNGNPNDAGAMWIPGEIFTDAANGVEIRVNSATTTGFEITISLTHTVIANGFTVYLPVITNGP